MKVKSDQDMILTDGERFYDVPKESGAVVSFPSNLFIIEGQNREELFAKVCSQPVKEKRHLDDPEPVDYQLQRLEKKPLSELLKVKRIEETKPIEDTRR